MNLQNLKLRHSSKTEDKKSHKKLWIIGTIVAVILLSPVLALGWMGIVPGVSNLMGTANPRDLGVKYNQSDLDSYNSKSKVQFLDHANAPADPKNPSQKTLIANPTVANAMTLTQEELTSAINSNNFSWLPVENSQVRITNDTIEISGSLNIDKLEEFKSYISDGRDLNQDIEEAITWAKRFANNVPIYAKGSAKITDNQLTFRLLVAEIGRFNIPLGDLGSDLSQSGTSAQIKSDYFSAKSATLTNGQLNFTGVYPSVIYVKP